MTPVLKTTFTDLLQTQQLNSPQIAKCPVPEPSPNNTIFSLRLRVIGPKY
jgi:hypothetical protein